MNTDHIDEGEEPRPAMAQAASVATIAMLCLMAWLTYTREGWIPFLSGVDFGIHELGHLLFLWAPRPVMVLAGSVVQVAAPLMLAAYFRFARRERLAAALLLGWAASSLNNVSVYIFDATRLALPLWGDFDGTGANHDWRYLLGPGVFDALGATDTVAYVVRGVSGLLFVAALGVAGSVLWTQRAERSRATRLEARRQTLEVREPRSRPAAAALDSGADGSADGIARAGHAPGGPEG